MEGMNDAQTKMRRAVEFLEQDLKTIRTGRANASMVENLNVVYYEQHMPLKSLANISVPDAKSVTIQPWDQNAVAAIEKAIHEAAELGLNPVSDGKSIHIQVPPLTSERRQQMVKQVGEKLEAAHVALRNVRHDVLNQAKRQKNDKAISEDEFKRIEKQLNEMLERSKKTIEEKAAAKRKELSEV